MLLFQTPPTPTPNNQDWEDAKDKAELFKNELSEINNELLKNTNTAKELTDELTDLGKAIADSTGHQNITDLTTAVNAAKHKFDDLNVVANDTKLSTQAHAKEVSHVTDAYNKYNETIKATTTSSQQLSNTLYTGVLIAFGATAKIAAAGVGNLSNTVSNITGIMGKHHDTWSGIHETINQTTKSLALTRGGTLDMREAMVETLRTTYDLGIEASDIAGNMDTFISNMSRNVQLSETSIKNMAVASKFLDMDLGEFSASMQVLGKGVKETSDFLLDVHRSATKIGLNSKKTISFIKDNIGILNKFSFRAGVKGLKEMALLSQQTGLKFDGLMGKAKELWSPEAAIDLAANLQMLGGEFSDLSDPFRVMYLARNAPQELGKSVAKAAADMATFNEETGEFDLDPQQYHQLSLAAEQLGMDYDNLAASAKLAARTKSVRMDLDIKGATDDDMTMIANLAEFSDGGRGTIKIDGKTKTVSEMKEADLEKLRERNKDEGSDFDSLIRVNQTISDKLDALNKSFTMKLPDTEAILTEKLGDSLDVTNKAIANNMAPLFARLFEEANEKINKVSINVSPESMLKQNGGLGVSETERKELISQQKLTTVDSDSTTITKSSEMLYSQVYEGIKASFSEREALSVKSETATITLTELKRGETLNALIDEDVGLTKKEAQELNVRFSQPLEITGPGAESVMTELKSLEGDARLDFILNLMNGADVKGVKPSDTPQ